MLWLENMGGKTSWLSLVFATLRPSLTEFLGKPDKQLGDYVLATDTAHVILEFAQVAGVRTLTGAGTRLLLGQVLQWRQHRQEKTRESAQLNRQLWAIVVPATGGPVTFERVVALIRTEDAQRRPLNDFTALIADAMQGDSVPARFEPVPLGRVAPPPWARYRRLCGSAEDVRGRGVDSERFHFQTGDQFVQWAMPYIIPPEVPDGIAAVVDQVRDTLAQRPDPARAAAVLRHRRKQTRYAATQQRQLDEQRAEATTVWDSSLRVADQYRAALDTSEQAARHHHGEAARMEPVAKDAQTLRNQRQQQWRQAQLVAAQLHRDEASGAHGDAQVALSDSQLRVDAWELTETLRRLGEVVSRLQQVDILLVEVDDRTAPLRTEVATAETGLAAKLTHLLNAEKANLEQVDQRLDTAGGDDSAHPRLHSAQAAHTAATTDVATAQAKLNQLDSEIALAIEDGLLAPGQPLDDAVSALDGHIERLHAEIERLTLVAEAAEEQSVAAQRGLAQAHEDESTARAGFEKAAARTSAVTSAAERLLDSPSVAAAFHSPSPDIWHDGPAAADRLAQDAAGRRLNTWPSSCAQRDKRAVDWLDRTGLLPPSPDVERVLATLAKAGVHGTLLDGTCFEHKYRPPPLRRHRSAPRCCQRSGAHEHERTPAIRWTPLGSSL